MSLIQILRQGKIIINYRNPGLITNDTLLYEFESYYMLTQQGIKQDGKKK